jgi:lipocalin
MSFERQKKDLVISDDSSVAVFNCEDEKNQSNWYLISNKALVEQEANEADLFVNQPIKKSSYLIPERKEVDYFVKIEDQDQSDLNELIQKIKSIPDIVTAYSLDYTGLKSKQNLIF